MKNNKKYNEEDLIKSLAKKRDCIVSESQRTITIAAGKNKTNDLGNGSWGKIDYLTVSTDKK